MDKPRYERVHCRSYYGLWELDEEGQLVGPLTWGTPLYRRAGEKPAEKESDAAMAPNIVKVPLENEFDVALAAYAALNEVEPAELAAQLLTSALSAIRLVSEDGYAIDGVDLFVELPDDGLGLMTMKLEVLSDERKARARRLMATLFKHIDPSTMVEVDLDRLGEELGGDPCSDELEPGDENLPLANRVPAWNPNTPSVAGLDPTPPPGAAIIHAPWTVEQVEALNNWQTAGRVHPFTCGVRSDHPDDAEAADDILFATAEGWICLADGCTYTQGWAWAMMLNEPPAWPLRPADG